MRRNACRSTMQQSLKIMASRRFKPWYRVKNFRRLIYPLAKVDDLAELLQRHANLVHCSGVQDANRTASCCSSSSIAMRGMLDTTGRLQDESTQLVMMTPGAGSQVAAGGDLQHIQQLPEDDLWQVQRPQENDTKIVPCCPKAAFVSRPQTPWRTTEKIYHLAHAVDKQHNCLTTGQYNKTPVITSPNKKITTLRADKSQLRGDKKKEHLQSRTTSKKCFESLSVFQTRSVQSLPKDHKPDTDNLSGTLTANNLTRKAEKKDISRFPVTITRNSQPSRVAQKPSTMQPGTTCTWRAQKTNVGRQTATAKQWVKNQTPSNNRSQMPSDCSRRRSGPTQQLGAQHPQSNTHPPASSKRVNNGFSTAVSQHVQRRATPDLHSVSRTPMHSRKDVEQCTSFRPTTQNSSTTGKRSQKRTTSDLQHVADDSTAEALNAVRRAVTDLCNVLKTSTTSRNNLPQLSASQLQNVCGISTPATKSTGQRLSLRRASKTSVATTKSCQNPSMSDLKQCSQTSVTSSHNTQQCVTTDKVCASQPSSDFADRVDLKTVVGSGSVHNTKSHTCTSECVQENVSTGVQCDSQDTRISTQVIHQCTALDPRSELRFFEAGKTYVQRSGNCNSLSRLLSLSEDPNHIHELASSNIWHVKRFPAISMREVKKIAAQVICGGLQSTTVKEGSVHHSTIPDSRNPLPPSEDDTIYIPKRAMSSIWNVLRCPSISLKVVREPAAAETPCDILPEISIGESDKRHTVSDFSNILRHPEGRIKYIEISEAADPSAAAPPQEVSEQSDKISATFVSLNAASESQFQAATPQYDQDHPIDRRQTFPKFPATRTLRCTNLTFSSLQAFTVAESLCSRDSSPSLASSFDSTSESNNTTKENTFKSNENNVIRKESSTNTHVHVAPEVTSDATFNRIPSIHCISRKRRPFFRRMKNVFKTHFLRCKAKLHCIQQSSSSSVGSSTSAI